jgi:DNA-binding MarR family transcriptional regulator
MPSAKLVPAMPNDPPNPDEVDRFIREEIDSVPQLEALLLIWNHRPKDWSCEDIARALYVSPDVAMDILKYLAQRRLIAEVSDADGRYVLLNEGENRGELLAALDRTYRRELVRVSTMIHSKASRAVRDFAEAFRFKKD